MNTNNIGTTCSNKIRPFSRGKKPRNKNKNSKLYWKLIQELLTNMKEGAELSTICTIFILEKQNYPKITS